MASAWFAEFKQRRVFRALVGYGVFSFGALQVVEPIMHALNLPEWVLAGCVVALGLGFPMTLVLAWVFDVNDGRIERTEQHPTTRRLAPLIALGVLLGAPGVAWYWWKHHLPKSANETPASVQTLPTAVDAVPPAAPTVVPSIAVLPFVDLSPGKDQEYFSDGIAEEILNALAQIEGLHVAGRTSSFSFKGKNEDLREVGKALGVGVVLEGSVRKAGSRLRITAQAITAADGFHIWSQTYDRELNDIFAVQDEIARAVAAVIQVKLLPGKSPVPSGRRTASDAAYEEFLVGRQFYNRHDGEGYRRAVEAFERSLKLDPLYAPAHAGLGMALAFLVNTQIGAEEERIDGQRRAGAEIERAVALAPELPEARVARGAYRLTPNHDWEGAREDLEKALAAAPADADALIWLGQLDATLGKLPDAIALTHRAIALDPLNPLSRDYLGRYLTASGDLAGARESFAEVLKLAPDNVWVPRELGFALLLGKAPEAALALCKTQQGWLRFLGEALAEHDLGHIREANDALHSLLALRAPPAYQVAEVYAWWGDRAQAFSWMDRALRGEDAGMRYIKYDPMLRDLRSDPRYTALLQRMKLPLD